MSRKECVEKIQFFIVKIFFFAPPLNIEISWAKNNQGEMLKHNK